jgi:RNA polymerase sigma factor (sigma-70 family)
VKRKFPYDVNMSSGSNLIDQHLGLAHVVAFDYANIPGITLGDAVSEAHGALIRASDGFDAAKGEFAPYASRAMRNALNSLYAKQLRMARLFPRSLDEPPLNADADASASSFGVEFPDSRQNVHKNVKRRETQSVLADVLRHLSPREQIVIEQMRLGRSLSEIGDNLGISKQAVHKVSAPALAKVKAALEASGYSGLDSHGFLRSASSVPRKPAG